MITSLNKYTLLTESRSIEISLNYTKSKILSIYNNSSEIKKIYRGLIDENDSKIKYKIIDPKDFNRTSKNTSNYYTLFMDNNVLWQNYPKRSKSLICTTNFFTADTYGEGNIFLVIPLDKTAKFGICPEEDLWYSFKGVDLEILNDKLKRLRISEKSYTEMINDIQKLPNKKIKDIFDLDTLNLSEILNPRINRFKINNYNDIDTNLYRNNEVWTDSECILIRVNSHNEKDKILNTIFN